MADETIPLTRMTADETGSMHINMNHVGEAPPLSPDATGSSPAHLGVAGPSPPGVTFHSGLRVARSTEFHVYKPPMKSVNTYANQKRVANGLFDIALMTANASQLKAVINSGSSWIYYTALLVLLSISIALQLATAILLLVMSSENYDKLVDRSREDNKTRRRRYWKLNTASTALIFCITMINVFVAAFGLPVAPPALPENG